MSRDSSTAPGSHSLDGRIAQALAILDGGIVSAYLFGSHAQDRAHRESDVDLAVLLDHQSHPTREDRFERRVRLTSELSAALGTNSVDLVILNDAPPLFARAIVTKGRRVSCTMPDVDHAFVRDVQLRAADLEPFLERTRAVKLKAIVR